MSSIYNLSTTTEDNTTSDTVDLWSDSDNDSLYNEFTELESQHEGIESTSNTVALTGPRIFALNQYEIVKVIEHDSKFESEFFSNINSLHSLLFVCDKAITILHNVSRDALAGTDASKEFVKGLEVSLKHSSTDKGLLTDQDVASKMDATKVVEKFVNFKRVRFVVSYFVIHIRQLGIDILSEVEQLELFKGKNFLDVKGKIISALKINLDKCNAQVRKLNSTLNCILQRDYLSQIQIDLGLNRLDENTLKILEELDSLEKKQREKHVEIKCQLDKLKNCSDLISSAQKMLPHTHSNVESKESRIKKLAKTIAEANEIIAKVPASASTPEYAQWLYWWSTKENSEKNENFKGTEDVDYYDSLAYVRKKGLSGSTSGDKKQNEKIRKDLTESYNVYNSKYKKAKEELTALINPFTSTMSKFQFKIGILLKKLMESPQRDWNAIRYFGCIETFVKSIENADTDGRSPFYSLITILKGIDSLISTDVELLSSDEKLDIFVAGKRLKKDAAFLIKFTDDLMYL